MQAWILSTNGTLRGAQWAGGSLLFFIERGLVHPSVQLRSLAFWLGIEACTPEDFEYDPPVPVGWDKVDA